MLDQDTPLLQTGLPTTALNTNPNSVSVHPMVICFRVRKNGSSNRLTLHVSSISPLPKSYVDAFNDPNWHNAMNDEYNALLKIILGLLSDLQRPILFVLDVKNAFLYGDLSETVYMHQPLGFWDSAHPDYVCLLQRQGTDTADLLFYVDDIVLTSSEILLERIIASL
ncbi:ribonuclease H-like domain-containing protein, partial [Tanacetum coccineum]